MTMFMALSDILLKYLALCLHCLARKPRPVVLAADDEPLAGVFCGTVVWVRVSDVVTPEISRCVPVNQPMLKQLPQFLLN